jgi:hypothetical protein
MSTSFKVVSTREANATSLRGYIKTTFNALVDTFGEPIYPDSIDGKVRCEWVLKFEDGTIATIYCWKVRKIPMYEYDWHIGGHSDRAVEHVEKFFNLDA